LWSIVSNMTEKRTRKNADDIAIVLYNHCVMSFCVKTIAFFIIMLFSRPYMWIDNLLTCRKHLHYIIISLRRKVWTVQKKHSLTRHFSLKRLYQARTVSGHDLSIGFWKCSCIVVFLVFSFIISLHWLVVWRHASII
jgi:hypothetical protein